VIYLAAPYTDKDPEVVEQRILAVTERLAELNSKGYKTHSPLLMHFCLNRGYELPGDYEFWKDFCTHFLKNSSELQVLCLPGWEESAGVLDEISYAIRNNIPVVFVKP
jgi:hypothetical protein